MKPLQQLHDERSKHALAVEAAKAALAAVDAEILAATATRMRALYEGLGKQHGTVSADVGEFVIKANVGKKVEWDSGKLMALASKMSWEDSTKLFDIEFAISEKNYNGIEDLGQKAEVDAARTTKYGELKVTLERKK